MNSACWSQYKRQCHSLSCALFLLASLISCKGTQGFQSNSSSTSSPVTIKWSINKETAVKTRGGYTLFIGAQAAFSVGQAIKTIDVPSNTISGAQAQISVSALPAGTYFFKVRAYSNLTNPVTAAASQSALSDEVSFNVQ